MDLKVVWLGQDPYHNGQATGISMGVNYDWIPPTLRILNESLKVDYGREIKDFSLKSWANQGVLLLNSSLSVRKGSPGSHMTLWKPYMVQLLKNIAVEKPNTLWVGLGKFSAEYINLIPEVNYKLLIPHPMVAVYSGNLSKFTSYNLFSTINNRLKALEQKEIEF